MNVKENQIIEQKTLLISLYGVGVSVFSGLLYGIYLESNAIILDGIFSSFSFIGTGLNWLTSRVVMRSPDEKFQYGYTHFEPLAQVVNALMMLIVCFYALINGALGIWKGDKIVVSSHGLSYALFMTLFCLGIWCFERYKYKKTKSELIAVDAAEWLIDLLFSGILFMGFSLSFLVQDTYPSLVQHIDNILVCLMAVVLIPIPIKILSKNLRQVLRMTGAENIITPKIEKVLEELEKTEDVKDFSTHIVKSGRAYFIEINILAGPNFGLQSIAQQDELRQKIVQAAEIPLPFLWLSLCITAHRKWHE
jgi:cation diffusion facilitator family transporter